MESISPRGELMELTRGSFSGIEKKRNFTRESTHGNLISEVRKRGKGDDGGILPYFIRSLLQ